MSSVSGGGFRGRGRGSSSGAPRSSAASRGTSSAHRGRPARNTSSQSHTARKTPRQSSRGGSVSPNATHRTNGDQADATLANTGGSRAPGIWQERYNTLRQLRERERENAIRKGLMSDPDVPRALADAITPVGTCPDMCPEFERVMRVVQDDVWAEETDPRIPPVTRDGPVPDEARMVKKFRRSAAGNDEQLPSDLRPPVVLKRTCDYLFNDVVGNAPSLAKVHHFVWDRTRAIRNDFSIQQLKKLEDLQIAIQCYERIARFHIVSLHLLALPEKPYDKYDAQQEREQLDRTLVSLVQYYDDCRGRFELVNETEFRAYTIIFQLRNPNADVEDRVQNWPSTVRQNPRVQKALQMYASACNTSDAQGPLKPVTSSVIARQDWEGFWQLVSSKAVSYLMACVAEIYFTAIRRMVLQALLRSTKKSPPSARATSSASGLEWSIDDLWELFNFDNESQLVEFCETFGFSFRERDDDGLLCLDLSPAAGRTLPEPIGPIRFQSKTALVEGKRYGRTIPAVIAGLNVRQAQAAGMIIEEEGNAMSGMSHGNNLTSNAVSSSQDDGDSLFIPETNDHPAKSSHAANANKAMPSASSLSNGASFGKPSPAAQQPSQGFGGFNFTQKTTETSNPAGGISQQSPFNFLGNQNTSSITEQKTANFPSFGSSSNMGIKSSAQPSDVKSPFSFVSGSTNPTNPFSSATKTSAETTQTPPIPGLFKQDQNNSFLKPETPGGWKTPETTSAQSSGATGTGLFGTQGVSNAPSSVSTNPFQSPQPTPFGSSTPQDASAVRGQAFNSLGTAGLSSVPAPDQQTKTSPTWAQSATPATSSASLSSQSETTISKPPQAPTQPQSSAPINPTPTPTSANPSGQHLRRQSMNDWKPKTPSKLSNSFTVSDDGSAAGRNTDDGASTTVNPSHVLVSHTVDHSVPTNSTVPAPSSATSNAPQQTPTFDSILTELADEFTYNPITGFLQQYVEFTMGRTITAVQEKIYYERVNKEADEFRQFCLLYRYGTKWRDLFRHQRLLKKGRARRERAKRRLRQSEQMAISDSLSVKDDASVQGSSRASTIAAPPQSRHQMIDALFQSTLDTSRVTRDIQAKAGQKRSVTSTMLDDHRTSTNNGHKRLKSNDNAGDTRSEISVSSSHPGDDELQRSSFLGFSLDNNAVNRSSTTKSTYFRLKALGIKPNKVDATPMRVSKRPRSEHDGRDYHLASPKLDLSTARYGAAEARSDEFRPSTLSPRPRSTVNDNDDDGDAIIARVRAARESLSAGSMLKASEADRDEHLRTSTGSASSSSSPSMALARAEARLRASRAKADQSTGRDVPAYRLRQSRFVPQDQYPRAIERAKAMRASRSRENSRPGSRFGEHLSENNTSFFDPTSNNMLFGDQNTTFLTNTSTNTLTADLTAGVEQQHAELEPGSIDAAPPVSFQYSTQTPFIEDSQPFSLYGASQADTFPRYNQGPPSSSSIVPLSSEEAKSMFGLTSHIISARSAAGDSAPESADYTIKPSQIPSALPQSFKHPHSSVESPFGMTTQGSTTPPHSSSFVPSQVVSETASLDSDRDERPATSNLQQKQPSPQYTQPPLGISRFANPINASANRFAAFANGYDDSESDQGVDEDRDEDEDEGEDEVSDEEELPQDEATQYSGWEQSHASNTLSYGQAYADDEYDEVNNGVDGDIESSDDGEEEEDESELYDDEEDEPEAPIANYCAQAPFKVPEFEDAPGANADEPIELSD